jgi:putative restriction endonuclease
MSLSRGEWALRIWVVLVGAAHHRQTLRYDSLPALIGFYGGPASLNHSLGRVTHYCLQNDLPQLTVLVVDKTGRPNRNAPAPSGDFDQERERVYDHHWYDMRPPSVEDFQNLAHLDGGELPDS